MGLASPSAEEANRRKGRTAWKMSRALAAGELAVMRIVLSAAVALAAFSGGVGKRSQGRRRGWNSRVLLPTSRPLVSASVAWASQAMEVTCWDLRPWVMLDIQLPG